ncbi:MAG TPA: ACT domain-containing protein [Verrucomicrobiota bacterium]|nr:ACT domain-containing protein [Verrucomicrobiota bacterium]
MQTPLVLTVIARDRTGLVESIARIVAAHDGNWLESRMCRLGGEFAGILRIVVPSDKTAALEKALSTLPEIAVTFRVDEPARAAGEQQLAALEVIGPDRPGIVREITHALAAQGVNVEELATEVVSAPMSGEPLFKASAKLLLPPGATIASVRPSLEQAAGALTVDFSLAAL